MSDELMSPSYFTIFCHARTSNEALIIIFTPESVDLFTVVFYKADRFRIRCANYNAKSHPNPPCPNTLGPDFEMQIYFLPN